MPAHSPFSWATSPCIKPLGPTTRRPRGHLRQTRREATRFPILGMLAVQWTYPAFPASGLACSYPPRASRPEPASAHGLFESHEYVLPETEAACTGQPRTPLYNGDALEPIPPPGLGGSGAFRGPPRLGWHGGRGPMGNLRSGLRSVFAGSTTEQGRGCARGSAGVLLLSSFRAARGASDRALAVGTVRGPRGHTVDVSDSVRRGRGGMRIDGRPAPKA